MRPDRRRRQHRLAQRRRLGRQRLAVERRAPIPGTPASRAIAPTVAGASPERTFSVDVLLGEEGDRLGRVRAQPLGEDDEAERPHVVRERRLRAAAASGASARPSASTRRPPAASPRARSASAGSAAAKRSGAPSTSRSSPRSSALQRRREENGTCADDAARGRRRRAPRRRSPPASRLRDGRARRVAGERAAPASPRRRPSAGTSSTTRSVGSVSVPVLSVQTTSTEASDSIAFSCCASTPRCAILNADTAAVRLISRIRPSGTRLTIPAVSAWTRAAPPSTRSSTETASASESGIASASSHSSSRSLARSSGERGWRKARAVAVSCAARLSGPTAVASKSAAPSTAKEPDQTGSPGAAHDRLRLAGQVGLVEREPVGATRRCRRRRPGRRPRGARGRRRRPRRPARRRSTPSRTTDRLRRDQRRQPVERALGADLLERPDRDVRDEDAEEERVLPRGERDRQHAEREQDRVGDVQRVRDGRCSRRSGSSAGAAAARAPRGAARPRPRSAR